jgi:hypothetical protein
MPERVRGEGEAVSLHPKPHSKVGKGDLPFLVGHNYRKRSGSGETAPICGGDHIINSIPQDYRMSIKLYFNER